MLDLTRLAPELQRIELTDDSLTLGALTTYWDVMYHAEVAAAFPLLAEAARQVGAVQIQTRGTWAGNVGNGSPAADGVPVMMAYDATVVLRSARGRREVPLDRYCTGYRQSVREPDELITAIRMPRRERDVQWFHKVGSRAAQTITKVGAAVVHDAAGWRVVTNSVAPVVCRCRNMEAALEGSVGVPPANAPRRFSTPDEVRQIIARDISPIDDLRSTAAFRLNVLARLLYFRFADSLA